MDNQKCQIRLDVISQAGQVALEFLRANPRHKPEDAIKDYNQIFKAVYQETTDIVTK